ncbi:MAG: zf-HC2 domain-containing protein [Acidobacteriota bacterium]|nr:zf-HC2 domain-containing protein [Acidobacteriota bacterium]
MNCIETKKNIEALLDGELEDEIKDAVEHHLWICAPCRGLREETASLSGLLQTSRIDLPSAELDRRVMKSFKNHRASSWSWRRVVFGAFVIPKPVFATLLILAMAGLWLSFQVGKISSTTISMMSPSVNTNEIPVSMPAETKTQTVLVEVPVIKEKIVTRTVYVRDEKNNKNEKIKSSADSRQSNLPLYGSTVAENGFFTDVSLKGFQPSAEIHARIIKEVKEDEK